LKHPWYNEETRENDIALIKLAEPLEYSEKVQPALLPSGGWLLKPKAGTELVVSGWGETGNGLGFSFLLKELSTEVESELSCYKKWSSFGEPVNPVVMLCATSPSGSACLGDSGAPLTDESTKTVYGIVSWGHPTCSVLPNVHTRVSVFKRWIENNAWM